MWGDDTINLLAPNIKKCILSQKNYHLVLWHQKFSIWCMARILRTRIRSSSVNEPIFPHLPSSFAAAVVLILISVLSAIGICERCKVQSGGVYFLIAHVLGSRRGAAVGIIYVLGQVCWISKISVNICILKFNFEPNRNRLVWRIVYLLFRARAKNWLWLIVNRVNCLATLFGE